VNFSQAINSGFKKYATFEGRASRSEYWLWALFAALVAIGAAVVDALLGSGHIFYILAILTMTLPGIAVFVRRLHDINRSGGWYWIALVPIIGAILLLVWACTEGTRGSNSYGSNPLGS